MTTTEAERIERERPEAIAWARAQANLMEADRALSRALSNLEATRARLTEASGTERAAWARLVDSRGLALENAVSP